MNRAVAVPVFTQRRLMWIVFVFAFLLYANSIRNGFSIDDRHVTVTTPQRPDNPRVARGLRGIPEIFTSKYIQDDVGNFEYRPIPLATFAIEYQFYGSNAHANHFFNVLIYAFTAALILLILNRLLAGYSPVLPLLATLLFIAHPVHTEVVNNIKSRDELLSFLFGLLSVYFFLQVGSHPKKWIPILKTVFFLLLALLSKRSAIIFIGMIVLIDIYFRATNWKRLFLLLAGVLLCYLIYIFFRRIMLLHSVPTSRIFTFYENPLFFDHDLLPRIRMAFFTTGYYARLLIFPYPLCFYYGYDAVPTETTGFVWMGWSVLFHGWLLYYAIRNIRKKEMISFFILVYFMGIAPFANLLTPVVGILGERFIYFSSLGFCLIAAYAFMKYTRQDLRGEKLDLKSLRPSLRRVALVVLVLFSVLVVARNTSWKDLSTLSENDVKHFEDSYQVQAFAANSLHAKAVTTPQVNFRQQYAQQARGHFVAAAAILARGVTEYPDDHVSATTLANLYVDFLRDADRAQPVYEQVLRKVPQFEPARLGLIHCYEMKGKLDTAIVMYQQMQRDGMYSQKIYQGLHDLYMRKENYPAALASDQQALKKFPHDVQIMLDIGNVYMMVNDTMNGLRYFEKAAAELPGDVNLLRKVADVFRLAGRERRAQEYERLAQHALRDKKK